MVLLICFIIPHVNFQQSDWSIGRVTILNVTRQCLTAVKFVVEMGHFMWYLYINFWSLYETEILSLHISAKECPAGYEYNECSSQCPRTCKALYTIMPDSCLQSCVSGCECPQGTFLQNGTCVQPDDCVCQYQRQNYKSGESIMQGCNKWWG